ncbi:MAG: GNAT family N-acetyltransferase [Ginsengibacter sp.]
MLSLNFLPFPILKTDRLILRQLNIDDVNEIFFLRSDESVNKYVDRPKPRILDDARKHIDTVNTSISNNNSIFWGITLIDNPHLIGTICLWNISKENDTAEVGFDLMPAFQKKGFMKEAFLTVARYGFDILKFSKLVGWVYHENSNSIALLRKLNFLRDLEEEAKGDNINPADRQSNKMLIYGLNASDYRKAMAGL